MSFPLPKLLSSADEVFQPGDVLRDGRYEIQRLLRSARDKQVYLARDRVLGCQVALDVFSNNSILPSGLTVSAWETLVLGQLGDHPNIATVRDHWEDGKTAFMVSRYLSGGTLRDRIACSQESGEGLPVGQHLAARDRNRAAGLRTSMGAASCTAICSLATCCSMSGARSIWWTSIPQCRSTTAI